MTDKSDNRFYREPAAPAVPVRLEAWIRENFAGHGRALRLETDAPLEGEPWMSMDEAKELTRQAVALFGRAATPAVGGEHGNFTTRAIKLIKDAAGHRDDWGKYEYAIIDLALEADAAQPASPLRGREPTDEQIEIACAAYAKAIGYYVEFHRGLSSVSSDEMRKGMRAALSASPPEQPAAAPVTGEIPLKLTGEIACILEDCGPPDRQSPEALAELIRHYQPTWDRITAALSAADKEPELPAARPMGQS